MMSHSSTKDHKETRIEKLILKGSGEGTQHIPGGARGEVKTVQAESTWLF